jgi:hypothetical protein
MYFWLQFCSDIPIFLKVGKFPKFLMHVADCHCFAGSSCSAALDHSGLRRLHVMAYKEVKFLAYRELNKKGKINS